jgi:hypothetical protein
MFAYSSSLFCDRAVSHDAVRTVASRSWAVAGRAVRKQKKHDLEHPEARAFIKREKCVRDVAGSHDEVGNRVATEC